MNFIQNLFTENDGVSWCIGRVMGFAAGTVMMYKFTMATAPDFLGFATGFAAIIAAISAKNLSERSGHESNH